jgi:hypothetical protein
MPSDGLRLAVLDPGSLHFEIRGRPGVSWTMASMRVDGESAYSIVTSPLAPLSAYQH